MTMNDAQGTTELGDADLVLRARSGDGSAFGELWRRHYRSGITVARSVSSFDADDLVQEAYTRIYESIQKGGGPTGSFRAYLFTSIRNTAAGWGRARKETAIDELDAVEDPATTEEATNDALDRGLTHQAFRSLPTRWQEVLWYSEIEGMKPAEIAPLLGLKATAVAQLAFRAREGLREAWIQAHLRSVADGSACQWTIERLGAHARNNLGRRDHDKVESHLAECTRCAIVASEAKEVGSRLALVLLPLTIGAAGAAGYLASLQGGGAPIVALAAMPGTVIDGAVTVGGSGAASLGSAAPGAAQPLLVPVEPVGTAASLGGAGSAAAAASGGAAAVAGATAAGGALSGIGAVTGIAAAGLLVIGSIVTAAVVVPALTSTPVSAQSAVVETVTEAPGDADGPSVIVTPTPTPTLFAPLTESAPPAQTPSPAPRDAAPRPSAPPAPPAPAPDPVPSPALPAPTPDPLPTPDPISSPDPEPNPTPTPEPEPEPEPEPTDPPEPVLPEGAPTIDDISSWFEGTRLTIGFHVTGDPGTQVHVTYDGADRGILTLDETGAAPMLVRPTVAHLLFGARLEVRFIAGDQTGPVRWYNVQDLVSLGDVR